MPLFGPPNIPQMAAKGDIQGLIKALAYKDLAIRLAAADALAPLKDPLAVEPLAALLKDESPRLRLASVIALAARGGFRVVEPLVGAMADPDPEIQAAASTAVFRRLMTDPDQDTRKATATALGRIHAAAAVEPLVKAVMDPDEGVRVASIKALHAIGDVAAVLPLIVVLAHEQVRLKATGRSSLLVERAASQALDALCDAQAIEPLRAALAHSDAEVREITVRRLTRVGSLEAADMLATALGDANQGIVRAAARGLQEIGWDAPADETGARYWVALRQWQHSAECGEAAIPLLLASFDQVDGSARMEIAAVLAQLGWEPPAADSLAAHYWAAQHRWDKCVEIGEPSVEALGTVMRSAPKWRDRIAAAGALVTLGQTPDAPCDRPDLVERALALIDAEGDDKSRRTALEAFLAEQRLVGKKAGQEVTWCDCGYPAARARKDGVQEPMADLLAFETTPSDARTYYCPNCDRPAVPAA
jgi:HEAT repeat protein